MILIDAEVFLKYLIFSKHIDIDSLKCRDVKEAVEMSKVDVFNKIQAEIVEAKPYDGTYISKAYVLEIIDKYRKW